MSASMEELESIRDIGHITALSVYEYLKENKELIEKLKSLGINMKYLGKNMGLNEFISGKKFVITGTIDGYGRKEIKELKVIMVLLVSQLVKILILLLSVVIQVVNIKMHYDLIS